jgi:energy-coupling factor transporter ATP-binding protein EcfA2
MPSSPAQPPNSMTPSDDGPAPSPASAPTAHQPSPSTPSRSPSSIRHEDRIFCTGTTGSGKSTLARRLFLAAHAPRLVIDPNDSDLTEIPGAVTFHDPTSARGRGGENWRQAATARFVPTDPYDLDTYDALYRRLFTAGPRWIWCDEAGIVLPSTGAPAGARVLLTQGRKRSIGHLACHTRPRWVDRDLIAQAAHVFIFSTPSAQDRRSLAENMGLDLPTLERAHAGLPEYGFLWWNQRAKHLTICDPL